MYHKEDNKQDLSINTYNFGVTAVFAEAKETVEHQAHKYNRHSVLFIVYEVMLKKQLIIQNIIQHNTTKYNVNITAS